jgi:anti-sigma B factor antagonist
MICAMDVSGGTTGGSPRRGGASDFQVGVSTVGGRLVCHLVGDLDAFAAPRLREAMANLAQAPALVIDLEGVPFLDSAGLGSLIGAVRRVRAAGGRVAVCSGRYPVARLLHVAGFDRIVPLAASIAEACAALDQDPAREAVGAPALADGRL